MAQGCKIGKIKFKSGGSLHVLPDRQPPYKETIMAAIAKWTAGIDSDLPNPVGFVCIAWDRDSTYTIHDYFSDGSAVCRSLGPSYVTECMRRRNGSVDQR